MLRLPDCCATVPDLEGLVQHRFQGAVSAVGLKRSLAGDFGAVARALAPPTGHRDVSPRRLRHLALGPEGRRAAAQILDDLDGLEDQGCAPQLSCVTDYPRDLRGLPVRTEVQGFHIDRAPVEVDTWLCTYAGGSTEILPPEDALRCIDDPTTRAALRQVWGLPEGEALESRIREGSFDLQYVPRPGASGVVLGAHHLWRLAVSWPGAAVAACIHRAPATVPGQPRLLLIA